MDLLPCPFCGSHDCTAGNWRGSELVSCQNCAAEGPVGGTRNEAVKAWNTRTFGVGENVSSDHSESIEPLTLRDL